MTVRESVGTKLEQEFTIRGMHCGACVDKITKRLRAVPEVADAEVTLVPPRAIVRAKSPVDSEVIRQAVARAGNYELAAPVRERAADARQNGAGNGRGNETENTNSSLAVQDETSNSESLYPLILIVGFIAGVTALSAIRTQDFAPATLMNDFMAGFFIVFGFFKLLDLPGFVDAYRSYDLIAKRVPTWGWVYPFVELTLGVAYFLALWPIVTNIVTLVLMLVGAAGVWRALTNKQRIRCACLGTALNLPMTTVTLVEDLGMAAMAGAMLILMAI